MRLRSAERNERRPRSTARVAIFLLLAAGSGAGCSGDSGHVTNPVVAGAAGVFAGNNTAGTTADPHAGTAGTAGAAGVAAPSAGSGSAANGGAGGAAGISAAGRGGSGGAPTATGGSGGEQPGQAGSSGSAGMQAGGQGGSMEPTACTKGTVEASEVVFIGESFIAATNAIPRFTAELARAAGAIGMNESYRSYAVSGTQLTTGDIPRQFTRAVDAGSVKVVLMDGGGNDLLQAGRCRTGFDTNCREIVEVVQQLFAQMKADGVMDVVYFFYPDPMGIGASIKGAMDILRPEMKKACDEASDVRCVWVDQRESWAGNYDEYTMDGIHPTDAGSRASAQQIWDAMVAHCIAQ
jgi:hypothetical protein